MGSCYSKPVNIECRICNIALGPKYIFCAYCKCRFHYKCLMHNIPTLERCLCGRKHIRFVGLHNIDNSIFENI